MNTFPIGIIDSGSGGLSIRESLRLLCPQETVIYFGDHLNLPYGSKSKKFIISRTQEIIGFLHKKYSCKLIIIACNTATVAGIESYRTLFPTIPIIGVVPVIKTAAEQTKTGSIAVLSTPFTTKSEYQKQLIKRFAQGKIVYEIGCPKLVSYIEQGIIQGSVIQKLLRKTLKKILTTQVDSLVLGCTHYPFIKNEIQNVLGSEVILLDSGGAVARQTIRILDIMKLTSERKIAEDMFLTTGNVKNVSRVAGLLIQNNNIQFQSVLL